MTPTIAVVIPNRNDSGHLVKCLDSVLNQGTPADQIIVVDDQSTNNSLDVICFSAIRAFNDNAWLLHAGSWRGHRYRMLRGIGTLLGKRKTLQLALAFVLLRPPFDLIAIIWYRFIGRLFVLSRMRNQKSRWPRGRTS